MQRRPYRGWARLAVGALLALSASACEYGPIRLWNDERDAGHDAGVADASTDSGTEDGSSSDLDAGDGGDAGGASGAGGSGGSAGSAGSGGAGGDSSVDDDAGIEGPIIEPLIPTATRFSDYVQLADPTLPCDPAVAPQTYEVCVHAGGQRVFELPDESSCAGLAAADTGYWFSWVCEPSGDHVRFVGTMHPTLATSLLIDFDTLTWRETSVRVERGGQLVLETEPQRFWSDPIVVVPTGATTGVDVLDAPGTVYVFLDAPLRPVRIDADHVTLTSRDSVNIHPSTSGPEPVIEALGRAFVMIDSVGVDAAGRDIGIDLDLVYSRVGDLSAKEALDVGIRLRGSAVWFSQLQVRSDPMTGIELGLSHSEGEYVFAGGALGNAIVVSEAHALRVGHVFGWHSDGHCLVLRGVSASAFSHLSLSDCDGHGLQIVDSTDTGAPSENIRIFDAISSNHGQAGYALGGSDVSAVRAIAGNNTVGGFLVQGSGALLLHTTVANDFLVGIELADGTTRADVASSVLVGNKAGLDLAALAHDNRVRDAFVVGNTLGLRVAGSDNVFGGTLWLTAPTSCALVGTPVNPGLAVDPECAGAGSSDVIVTAPHAATGVFVERVAGDLFNPAVLDAMGEVAYDSLTDWNNFEVRGRYFGAGLYVPFPSEDLQGRCVSGEVCSLWDLRLDAASAAKDRLGAPLFDALVDPAHVVTHVWSASNATDCAAIVGASWQEPSCTTRFLDYAYEMDESAVENNGNGLCEPGESCMLNRNLGAYPGEGSTEYLDSGTGDGRFDVPGFGFVHLTRHVTNGP